jgi:hypothetical protein
MVVTLHEQAQDGDVQHAIDYIISIYRSNKLGDATGSRTRDSLAHMHQAPRTTSADGAVVEFGLVRHALLARLAAGQVSRDEVCDAHPELVRAARSFGRGTGERCPVCHGPELVEVTYVFGPRLPAGGACPSTRAELARFERREDSTTLQGKLQDELGRLRDALEAATPSSLFILNEMFNSTTAQDALLLSRGILGQVEALDALCVCVTFLDELASFNDKTVSMVAGVDPADPAVRTHRITRRPADGRAYARALAEKYGLTYEQLSGGGRR